MLDNELKIKLAHEIIDPTEFDEIVIDAYNNGIADEHLAAYHFFARSVVPAGTAGKRKISIPYQQIHRFVSAKCTACMDCVNLCPDSAIKVKVLPKPEVIDYIDIYANDEDEAQIFNNQFAVTDKLFKKVNEKNIENGKFILAVDPNKCKGCLQCINVCKENALTPRNKDNAQTIILQSIFDFFKKLPETDTGYIDNNEPKEQMLNASSLLYTGGTSSCRGCGETPAIRMMLAAAGAKYGKENIGIVNENGCIFDYSLEYPYNPFLVPVMNSSHTALSSNAIGIKLRWDQQGKCNKKLWIISRSGKFNKKGIKDFSQILKNSLNIKILILDKDSINNNGPEIIEEYPKTFFAQVVTSNINHFYEAIIAANEFNGPAVINAYSACQPVHGIADDKSQEQARLAVDSRTFPLFIYDPRKGKTIKDKLALKGNPEINQDWHKIPNTEKIIDFISFARKEKRFSNYFEDDESPKPELMKLQNNRLNNWKSLKKLADII